MRCLHRAQRILKDNIQLGHDLFILLLSGKRCRSIRCRTTRLQSSFLPSDSACLFLLCNIKEINPQNSTTLYCKMISEHVCSPIQMLDIKPAFGRVLWRDEMMGSRHRSIKKPRACLPEVLIVVPSSSRKLVWLRRKMQIIGSSDAEKF